MIEMFDRGDRVMVTDDRYGVASDEFVGREGYVRRVTYGFVTKEPLYAVVLDGRRDEDDELFHADQLVLVGELTARRIVA